MELDVICKQHVENAITSIAAAFGAGMTHQCTETRRATARGFYAALHAVALSFGVQWSEAKLMGWTEEGDDGKRT